MTEITSSIIQIQIQNVFHCSSKKEHFSFSRHGAVSPQISMPIKYLSFFTHCAFPISKTTFKKLWSCLWYLTRDNNTVGKMHYRLEGNITTRTVLLPTLHYILYHVPDDLFVYFLKPAVSVVNNSVTSSVGGLFKKSYRSRSCHL